MEKDFLTDVYTQLLEIQATLDIIEQARAAINDTKILGELESIYVVVGSLKKHVNRLADKVDGKIYA